MLDINEIQREYARCYADKTRIYLIEHYLSTQNGSNITPFLLFPRQKEFCKSLAYNNETIAIKHRQAGITTVSAGWIAGQIVMASKTSPETVLCIANKLEMAQDMLGKIRTFLEQLPRWMWGNDEYFSMDPTSPKNTKSIFTIANSKELRLFNGCRVVAKSSGENAARGVSAVSILILDEAAFIEEGTAVYASAVAATSSVRNARTIMVSTPNGKDLLYYNTYKLALEKKNNFNAVEFKWFQDLRYNKFLSWSKKDEKTGEITTINEETLDNTGTIIYDEEKWRKLENEGWIPSSPWYVDMCNRFNHDTVKIAQELDVSFVGSSNTVLSPDVIEMQRTLNCREPLPNFTDPLAPETWVWKLPEENHRYILALDPARGDGSDSSVIEIIDMDAVDENGMPITEQVLEYQGKLLGDEIGEMVYNYARMYNNAFVVIECIGGVGDATVLTLMRLGYKNLYYDDNNLKNYTSPSDYYKYKNSSVMTDGKLPGFHSNNVRFQMLSNFASMVKTNQFVIHSIRLVNELETWVFKNGRQDHMNGMHDDTITCSAMALFVMLYSFNKIESIKSKDAAILNAYMTSNSLPNKNVPTYSGSLSIKPKSLPIYSSNKSSTQNVIGPHMWLFSKCK